MTVLVDFEILNAIRCREIIVDPFDESLINPGSLDIRLGKTFGKAVPTGKLVLTSVTELGVTPRVVNKDKPPKMCKGETIPTNAESVIDMTDKESFKTEYFDAEEVVLRPGEFILASMMESITLSDNIQAIIKGKSSVGRLGVTVGQAGGVVDQGWSGVLGMSVVNDISNTVVLRYGQKIGQMIFTRTETPDRPYSVTGRYQGAISLEGSQGV